MHSLYYDSHPSVCASKLQRHNLYIYNLLFRGLIKIWDTFCNLFSVCYETGMKLSLNYCIYWAISELSRASPFILYFHFLLAKCALRRQLFTGTAVHHTSKRQGQMEVHRCADPLMEFWACPELFFDGSFAEADPENNTQNVFLAMLQQWSITFCTGLIESAKSNHNRPAIPQTALHSLIHINSQQMK